MKQPEAYLMDVVRGVQIASVLDVGTGHGGVFHYHWWQGQDLGGKVCVDVHSFRPDIVGWGLVLADARMLPFRDKVFDHVQSTEMIEHIPPQDHPKVVSELKRVARKTVFLTSSGPFHHEGPEQEEIEKVNPFQAYQDIVDRRLLEEEGFDILYYNWEQEGYKSQVKAGLRL